MQLNYQLVLVGGLSFVLLSKAYALSHESVLRIDSRSPVALSVSEGSNSYPLSISVEFMEEIEDIYDNVYLQDLNGDGVQEVVFKMSVGAVNSCSRILIYEASSRSLSELIFPSGDVCNFEIRGGYLISSYRDGAMWKEDVYNVAGGTAQLILSDVCIGCGEVRRKQYGSDGSSVNCSVSDDRDFEKRKPLDDRHCSLSERYLY